MGEGYQQMQLVEQQVKLSLPLGSDQSIPLSISREGDVS
jgi:hypothetical protein